MGKRLSKVFGKISRPVVTVTLLAALVGCSTSSPTDSLSSAGPNNLSATEHPQPAGSGTAPPAGAGDQTPVVQAFCPPLVLNDETAIDQVYAKGGQGDPQKLLYQASFNDFTRQCTANDTTLTVNAVVQGRLVEGPGGAGGQVTLPILVEVMEGDKVISSQKVAFPVAVPTGGTQFIFNKPDIQIPNQSGGISHFTRVRIGFDLAPAAKTPAKGHSNKKRG